MVLCNLTLALPILEFKRKTRVAAAEASYPLRWWYAIDADFAFAY